MMNVVQKEPGVVDLSGSLTIHTVKDLYEKLSALPSGEDTVHPLLIVLEQVDEIDMAGMQTLLAFKLSRPRESLRFAVSESLRNQCRSSGLERYLFSEE